MTSQSNTSEVIELSVVLPAFHEADGLSAAVDRISAELGKVTENHEIIVIDDGSTDNTFQIISDYHDKDHRVKGVRFSRNFGKEAALLAGLERAAGKAVITIDADMQHPVELIGEFYKLWQQGYSVVHGVKKGPSAENLIHRTYSRLFNAVLSWLAGFDMIGASDYKLLDARVVNHLVREFPERGRFYRGLSQWMGFKQTTIPFTVQSRSTGVSQWSIMQLARYGWRAITAFSALPLQVVPMLGGIMFIVAIVLGGEAIISRLYGDAASGFATLEITILFTGSLIMIGLGVVGQYLGRIYDELKSRPNYLVEEDCGFD